ncbi:tetratricopeptide repeat protein [Mariniblastus sp.]|nr:tetratricopeptide repeat protein [Mariniblastus sp.]MDC3224909.1 tetratricopeptide repeat protein [Mariniblastus sp.]
MFPATNPSLRYIIILSVGALVTLNLLVTTGCKLGADRHNAIGCQAYNQGQITTAIAEFNKAIEMNPNDADAIYNLGASYYAIGKQTKNLQATQSAEQLYRRTISIDDQHQEAHRSLAVLLIETGQEQYAFDLINSWKNRYPTSTEPVVELAKLYQEYGDNSRATDLLVDALKINPNDVQVLAAMGSVREAQGQSTLALDSYIRALQIDPKQPQIAAKVASLQNQLAQLPSYNSPAGGTASPTTPAPARYGSTTPYQKF